MLGDVPRSICLREIVPACRAQAADRTNLKNPIVENI
jgi:hypothetical protein